MKIKLLLPILLFLSVLTIQAQQDTNTQQYFTNALQEISAMLDGKQTLDFERAVFITENAYRSNAISYQDFKASLDIHASIIERLIKANAKDDFKKYQKVSMGIPMETDEQTKENYRKALANWAIYTYLTDTTKINVQGQQFLHLPYAYSNDDPFGSIEWKNSQVLNLLETQKGNCYALVTLFKIFSERFHSEANIVTAPQHVYIEHRDPKGDLYNVEVATRSFPGTGSIQTLTYTTREALLNNISLRSLNLKQSIGLCLVYLAKGYEHKYKAKADGFLLTCAEKVLEHDAKNLNALLLKAQVHEQRVMKKEIPAAPYEKMLAELYALGYRQMPDDMKAIILAKIQGNSATATINKTPNPFESIGEQARYATLSGGIFEEVHTLQKLVRVGQTIFNTEKGKIEKFLEEDNSSYQVDPVVFALSVDPLTKSYPELTPYQFASNRPIDGIDLDGLEYYSTANPPFHQMEFIANLTRSSENQLSAQELNKRADGNQNAWTKGIVAGAALSSGVVAGRWLWGNWVHVVYNPILQNEVAATIYGSIADDEWPLPAVGDNAAKTSRVVYKGFRGPMDLTSTLTMHKGASFANDAEKSLAIYLTKDGHNVEVLQEVAQAGQQGQTSDFLIDGVKTEVKSLSGVQDKTSEGISKAIKKRISNATSQSKNVIIDLREQEGATLEIAERGVNRYFGQSQGNIQSVRVIGKGFDKVIPYKKK